MKGQLSAVFKINMSDVEHIPESSGQINFHWKIEKFFNLPVKDGSYLKSPMFLFSDAKWYLKIYLSGDNNIKSSGWINLHLCCSNSATEHRVGYRLGILKTDGSEFCSRCSSATFVNNPWGWNNLISRSDLLASKSEVAPDDTLTVFCSIHLIADWTIEVTSKKAASDSISNLSENLKDSYHKKLCADVTLIVKNRYFFANKFILMTRSTVFTSMFDHEMREKHSGIVEIDDCDPDSFEEFLLFLYTGKIDFVSSVNALSLYKTADKYDVQELKYECVRCMGRHISVDSFCDVIRFASLYNEYHLLSIASDFFMKNIQNIISVPEWEVLLTEKPSLGNELFSKFIKKNATESTFNPPSQQGNSFQFTFSAPKLNFA